MKEIKVMSLFSGIGAFEKALTNQKIPYKLINFCEIDKPAIESYCAIHNEDKSLNLGDISNINTSNVENFDLLVGGSPCFPKGTLIFTDKGYKNIEDIKVNDKVLTHKNRFMTVDRIGHNPDKDIFELKAMGTLPITATPNHPFLVVTKTKKYKNENGEKNYYYEFSEPYKKRLDELEKGKDFLCSPILNTEENFYNLDKETCWLLGRYVADGHLIYKKRKDRNNSYQYAVVYSIGSSKVEDFISKISNFSVSKKAHSQSVYRCNIYSKDLVLLIKKLNLGEGAINKQIPNKILNLPKDLLKSFIDGYMSGDGCYIEKTNVYQTTAISKKLAMTLQLAIQKVYRVGCKIYFNKRPSTYVIEGRTVNQNSTYIIRFSKEVLKQKHYHIKDNYILYPIKSIKNQNYKDTVYNLEVKEDHTYMVNSIYVHNCQDFSISGKTKGSVWTCKDCDYEYNPLMVHIIL